jgi:hypothetical protein
MQWFELMKIDILFALFEKCFWDGTNQFRARPGLKSWGCAIHRGRYAASYDHHYESHAT